MNLTHKYLDFFITPGLYATWLRLCVLQNDKDQFKSYLLDSNYADDVVVKYNGEDVKIKYKETSPVIDCRPGIDVNDLIATPTTKYEVVDNKNDTKYKSEHISTNVYIDMPEIDFHLDDTTMIAVSLYVHDAMIYGADTLKPIVPLCRSNEKIVENIDRSELELTIFHETLARATNSDSILYRAYNPDGSETQFSLARCDEDLCDKIRNFLLYLIRKDNKDLWEIINSPNSRYRFRHPSVNYNRIMRNRS